MAFLAGAVGVFAFAPFYAWPVALISLAPLFWLWHIAPNAKRAAAFAFVWGLGLFLAGVSWLYVALHVYGNMPAPLAALAIFLFCVYLSLFPMLAGLLAYQLRARNDVVNLLLVMPACFVVGEYLRGWFVSGFPWLIFGYSQTPGGWITAPLAGFAPMLGVFGLSWILALTAAMMVAMMRATLRVRMISLTAVVLVWGAGIAAKQITWSTPSGAPLTVALLQGNVDQAIKMRDDVLLDTMRNYLELANSSRAKLIVMPETAIPRWLNEIPESYLALLKARAVANGGDMIVGLPTLQPAPGNEPPKQFNSAVSFGISPTQTYSKDHLVAFGEFIPPLFSWVYQWLTIPLSGFSQGGQNQAPMRVSGHRVAVNICYEDTFGAEIAGPAIDAELLVNIANMAWYGRSLAAEQHLQFSQMRALETSRWMLRATNTGLTAAVNERGEVVRAMPQFIRGVLAVEAVPRQGATLYARWKDWPVMMGVVLALLMALARKWVVRE